MNEEIKSLIESLRRGNYEDPSEKISLLAAAVREQQADVVFLITLLTAPQVPLRLAGMEACVDRKEEELHAQILRLAGDRDARVRAKAAEWLGAQGSEGSVAVLKLLAADADGAVRMAAIKATSGRPAFLEMQRSLLLSESNWSIRMAAARGLHEQEAAEVARDFMVALATDPDSDIQQYCAEALEQRLTGRPTETRPHLPDDIGILNKAEHELKPYVARCPQLVEWLRSRTTVAVDPQALARFGTNLTAMATSGLLPRAYGVEEACQALIKLIWRDPWKSIVLLGESGVGKSALVNELVHELAKPEQGAWIVLRVSPTDFVVGTKYSGEWETRVAEFVKAVRKPRRVVVYVPNLSDLAAVGRWSKSDANVASALAPHLEDGSVLLLGESTPDEFERGLGAIPSLQRLFDKVLIPETSAAEALAVLRGICDEAHANISDDVLGRLQEVSDFFLSHLRRPGNAATLLRTMLGTPGDGAREISFREVLAALSQSSGVPARLLDDEVALEAEEIRAFFDQRIMGQPEAVRAVVDLVSLIKAGLTDPHKPFGVLLFVGPTGVGKTELARALAEFIFGDPKRLLRFDMTEFSSPDGYQRLIGGRGENGLLTDALRQQPFSVVLFDEIEKSHLNVFDLCLQIFDAGRLTDGRGRLVDFRRAIVILTSNVGAEAPATPLGFGAAAPVAPSAADQERTWRELSRFFRPEFLNRIDRIVHFHPLSLEVAERIARREIDLVLQRSGVARRGLTVRVDPSVIAFLVREGYSPHFGARPLKRTVEQQLLIPLARTIAAGRVESDGVLTAIVADGRITLHPARRAAPPVVPATPAPGEPAAVPAPPRLADVRRRLAILDQRVEAWRQRKSELLAQTSEPGFYHDPARRAATFDEVQKLERFLERVAALHRACENLEHRLSDRSGGAQGRAVLLERLAALSLDVAQAEMIAGARNAADLTDALVQLSRITHEGSPISGVEQLARLYEHFARRHRLAPEFLVERFDDKQDHAVLLVSGLGAHALLQPETGLHKLNRRSRHLAARGGREKTTEDSELIQVEVFPVPGEPDKKFIGGVTMTLRELKPRRSRLLHEAAWQVRLFHPASVRSLETWASGTRAEAQSRALQVLHAQVGVPCPPPATEVIRHYDLGIGSRIKDSRTGRSTTRIAQFFKGRIELVRALAPTDDGPVSSSPRAS